ncbi:MAG: hypothetical protein Q8R08_02860 [bacterium]|nr:hypothetical protein [bacterium]
MAILLPSILTKDPDEILEKLKFLEAIPGLTHAQIDFADGKFVANTLAQPKDIGQLSSRLVIEAHLMVMEPQKYYHDLQMLGVNLVFIHFESFKKNEDVLTAIRNAKTLGLRCGLAVNPNTPINVFDSFINDLDESLIMGVNPGLQGQKFIAATTERISTLRDRHNDVIIEVDGGVKLDNFESIVSYGVNKINVGSGIWQTPDAKQTIYDFLSKLKNS